MSKAYQFGADKVRERDPERFAAEEVPVDDEDTRVREKIRQKMRHRLKQSFDFNPFQKVQSKELYERITTRAPHPLYRQDYAQEKGITQTLPELNPYEASAAKNKRGGVHYINFPEDPSTDLRHQEK